MSFAPTNALSNRHQSIRRECRALSLDALIITTLPNLLYLTNFTGSSAVAVLTAEQLFFITDFRYVTAVESARGTASECPTLQLVRVESSYDETLATVVQTMAGARVGFEAQHVTVSRHRWLADRLDRGEARIELVPTDGLIEQARRVKDAHEVATLREAAMRLSVVAGDVLRVVRRGVSERELALDIDWRMRAGGFERPAFDTIVASGPNAALPHARPTERKLTEGDLVVLDFGGVYDSYCVDLTRTVFLGRATSEVRAVYDAVREAHDRAIQAVAPGRSRFAIDAAARDVLTARGLGDAFGHGTGHGLGIEVHEDPRITRRRPDDPEADPVAPGMVFTIEPGAYLPGWGGVRIEDDVLVTDTGADVLTDVTTEMREI